MTLVRLLVPLALVVAAGCIGDGPDTDTDGPDPIVSTPRVSPLTPTTLAEGDIMTYVVSGLDDRQAYRVTLVHSDFLTPSGEGTAVFQDADANETADPGPSEEVALITQVNGSEWVPGFKTVPGSTDDPANPTGIFPGSGEIVLTLLGVGPGTIHPVAYHNGGASTFLEVDGAGVPVETYGVGGSFTVTTAL